MSRCCCTSLDSRVDTWLDSASITATTPPSGPMAPPNPSQGGRVAGSAQRCRTIALALAKLVVEVLVGVAVAKQGDDAAADHHHREDHDGPWPPVQPQTKSETPRISLSTRAVTIPPTKP